MQSHTEDLLKRELEALPKLSPPPEAEARVLAAMRAAAQVRTRRHTGRFAGLAAAASLSSAALLMLWQPWTSPEERLVVTAADTPSDAQAALDDYLTLVEQSARLERALVALPQRTVMRAGTAGTIATLEDRIAHIDAELTLATAAGAENQYRTALWRDRVDVMNALLQVRYVNSQAFVF
jgi:hypothetical protein